MQYCCLLLGAASGEIDIRPFNPVALVLLLGPLFFLRRRGKSAGYLWCFSLFFLYLWAVFAYAVGPLPFGPGWLDMLREEGWDGRINLIPGAFLHQMRFWAKENVYGNILLGMPFGFGLPFVMAPKNSTPARLLGLGFAFAAGLELLQLGISLIFYGFPYRSIDIDDVSLVFVGTLLGHVVLRVAARVYRRLGWAAAARLPVWNHFHAVLLNAGRGLSARLPARRGPLTHQ